jgi:hypothetical protein
MGATRMSKFSPNIVMHLMRKEWRQLTPLLAMLAIIGFSFHLMHFIIEKYTEDSSPLGIVAFLGMPSLFAVGLGAILVGQEKDQRTILWLRSLPIKRTDIIKSKLFVALTGICVVWLVSAAFYFANEMILQRGLTAELKSSGLFESPVVWMLWPINTIWLAIVGVAMAWRFKSSFASLVALIPIAFVPWIVANCGGWSLDLYSGSEIFHWLVLGSLLFGSSVLAWYGWRSGIRFLGPTPSPRATVQSASSSVKPSTSQPWLLRSPQTPSVALNRQFAMQSRGLLAALALTILIGSAVFTVLMREPPVPGEGGAFSAVLVALATCWLGVLSFHGDKLRQRIRFLADRGVSPFLVWRTRHALPLAILVTASLLVMGVVLLASPTKWTDLAGADFAYRWKIAVLAGLGAWLGMFGCYSFSQWIGQAIRSPIVAAIVAPAFTGLIAFTVAFAYEQLGAHVLVIALVAAIPMFATLRMMKLWMDGSDGWRFKLWHVAWLGLSALLLATTVVFEYAKNPGMPQSLAMKMQGILSETVIKPPQGNEAIYRTRGIFPQTDGTFWVESAAEAAPAVRNYRKVLTEVFEEGFRTSSIVGLQSAQSMVGIMLLDRMTLLNDPGEMSREKYVQSVDLVLRSIVTDRKSLGLYEQELADLLEMSLLRELKRPNARENIGDDLWNKCRNQLASREQRDQQRRVAIAANWDKIRKNKNSRAGQIDAFHLPGFNIHRSNIRSSMISNRIREQAIAHLWAILDAQTDLDVRKAREVVADDWNRPLLDDEDLMDPYQLFGTINSPGRCWRAKWEKEAADLPAAEVKTQLSSTNQSKVSSEGQNE